MKILDKKDFLSPLPLLRRSKTVFKNFLILTITLFTILCAASVLIYHYSKEIMEQEITRTNENMASNIAQSLDDLFQSMQRITASLSTSQMVRLYFTTSNSSSIFEGFTDRIVEQINAYVDGLDYIYSIYVYSPANRSAITSSGEYDLSTLPDAGWLEVLDNMDNRICFFPRKVNGFYPYVLTLVNHTQLDGTDGYVILNINLRRLPEILQSDVISDSYIVTDKNEVLYWKAQMEIALPVSDFSKLTDFIPSVESFSKLSREDSPYIYTQKHSSYYSWSYVAVTSLEDYIARLSALQIKLMLALLCLLFFVVCFTLFLSARSYRPIQKLLHFLNNPGNWSAAQNMDEQDISSIAQKIVLYAQTNDRLSAELQSRLTLLNQTQMVALQAQVNPHFLVNTLNLIHCSIVQDLGYHHLAANMTVQLGRLLHYVLESTALVTIKEEFEYVQIYLNILKERYRHKIQTILTMSPDTVSIQIPRLIIQPIIENCIYHGAGKQLNPGFCISVKTELVVGADSVDYVRISVEDNGVGIPSEQLEDINRTLAQENPLVGKHVGLRNVAARMKLLYGDQCSLAVHSYPNKGTCVILSYPAVRQATNYSNLHN